MSFSFGFQLDDVDEQLAEQIQALDVSKTSTASVSETPQKEYQEWTVEQLLDALPSDISFSSLAVGDTTIYRRDLFDARLQLIAKDDDETDEGLQFIDAPSDLVTGVYEGGLKSWECSSDLAQYLQTSGLTFSGKRILEVGCGTAVPSLYILQKLLSDKPSETETVLTLQDYNASVLRLVTFPNVILNWAKVAKTDDDQEEELDLSDNLKREFIDALQAHNIRLVFTSGSWASMSNDAQHDLILTSETIYRSADLPDLLRILQTGESSLVAAKVVYFGVGGGVVEFKELVEKFRGQVEIVWSQTQGVGRQILRVEFPK